MRQPASSEDGRGETNRERERERERESEAYRWWTRANRTIYRASKPISDLNPFLRSRNRGNGVEKGVASLINRSGRISGSQRLFVLSALRAVNETIWHVSFRRTDERFIKPG